MCYGNYVRINDVIFNKIGRLDKILSKVSKLNESNKQTITSTGNMELSTSNKIVHGISKAREILDEFTLYLAFKEEFEKRIELYSSVYNKILSEINNTPSDMKDQNGSTVDDKPQEVNTIDTSGVIEFVDEPKNDLNLEQR